MSKVAVVTGGASGIGESTVRRLAADGFCVWALDQDVPNAERVAAAVGAEGGDAHALHIDVADEQSVARAFAAIASESGSIDVLVNGAGIVVVERFDESQASTWERVFAVNVLGTFLCLRYALPSLRRATPPTRVINLSSSGAKMPGPFTAAYNASKAAVVSLTRSAAAWLAPEILVNCVCPGVIDTPMWQYLDRELADKGAGHGTGFAGRTAALPIKRAGNPQEVAAAIAFLASADGGYVVGEDLNVNGGYAMH